MNARFRFTLIGCLLALSLLASATVGAQGPEVEWESWNVQITAYENSQQLDIAETQLINVTNGDLHSGQREYSQPVDIQEVYIAINNDQPQQLGEGTGPGTYQVTNDNGEVFLDYELPYTASAGDRFAVQVNYTVDTPTNGLIDWFAVPAGHDAPVGSSTITINFPDGQVPDPSLVRLPQGQGTVTTSGNTLIVQSQGAIPANQAFEIQVPYGANVGDAGSSNGSNGSTGNSGSFPAQQVPAGGTTTDTGSGLPGLGTILGIVCLGLCAVGALIIFGGGTLLSRLLGGLLGGGSQTPTTGSTPTGNTRRNFPFGGGSGSFGGTGGSNQTKQSGGRGFRQSTDQNRELPTIKSDPKSGGGETFK